MPILDAAGRPAEHQTKLIAASDRYSRATPWTPDFTRDLDDLFTQTDWRATVSQSRVIFSNFGAPRGAIFQRAEGTVGRAWEPEFKGKDQEFGAAAKDWLTSWFNVCDIAGSLFPFKQGIRLSSIALDRDGDIFVLLTETKGGYPQIQYIPAHRVGTRPSSARDHVLLVSKYRGNKIVNGVVTNKAGSPIAYCVLGDDASRDEYISTRDMVHIADCNWHNQTRGIPCLSHAIREMRQAKTSAEWELMAQLMVSSHALIEYNENAGIDLDDPSVSLTGNIGDDDRLAVQSYSGGMVRHFKSNSGSKLESIDHSRPGDMWESFQDRIIREALAGIPWPMELVWKSENVTGTSIRNIQARARASVEMRQDVLRKPAQRIIAWAVAKAIKLGLLPSSDDWWRWDFTMPPKLSIDPKNDSRQQIEEYKLGAQNMTQLLQERGKTYSEHIRERCMEVVERKIIKEEFEAKYGVEIDPRELQMLTPNDMPQEEPEPQPTTEENDTDE